MSNKQYRVILSGRLLSGFRMDEAMSNTAEIFDVQVSELQGILDGSEHAVGQLFDAERALDLMERLKYAGVGARIESVAAQKKAELVLRSSMEQAPVTGGVHSASPGMMRCPACGHRQPVSNRCTECGVVFVEYQRELQQRETSGAKSGSNPFNRPRADYQRDFVVEKEHDEMYYLALYFGRGSDALLKACAKYIEGIRTLYAPGWNWVAVISPFLWAMYRKMWLWASVLYVTEILIPTALIAIGYYDAPVHKLIYLGYAGLVANRLVWPAVLNYFYCRQARGTLRRLHMMSSYYPSDADVSTAGGVSRSFLALGLVLAMVTGLFFWSLMNSIYESSQQVIQQRVAGSGLSQSNASGNAAGGTATGDGTGAAASSAQQPGSSTSATAASAKPVKNRWAETQGKLAVLAGKVKVWLEEHPGVGVQDLSLYRVRQDLDLPSSDLVDAWGNAIQLIPDKTGYRLVSAGPDGLFGTVDDIQFRYIVSH